MEYEKLCEVYDELEKTTKRLEKTDIISKFIRGVSEEDLSFIVYLLEGRVFPKWDPRKLGMSSQLMLRVIASSTGISKDQIIKKWKKIGDLGLVASELVKDKKQKTLFSKKLSVKKVFENIQKLAGLEGKGTVDRKIQLISELLTSASSLEAKYLVRTVLDELRIGVAEGILRDAIAKAFDRNVKDVEKAFELLVDYAKVAEAAKKNRLKRVKLGVGKPIKVMLAIRVEDIEEGFKAMGRPAQFEPKLDGFRVQIHKNKDEIKLFTRRLENVTNQFKEVVPLLRKNIKTEVCILDSEFVGYDPKTEKYLPFQKISQRIKRKYNIEEIAKRFPVEVNVFDIINYNGEDLSDKPLEGRRMLLEKQVEEVPKKLILTRKLITGDTKKSKEFYKECLDMGCEGVMIKEIEARYKPGRRVHGWVKLKPVMETLDLVITGAIWGEGKRAKWLSSFILSCRDKNKFLEVGKVGTGIKEKYEGVSFADLTRELRPLVTSEEGKSVRVKAKVVVEVAYEEIQKSPSYSSGYALRFPRVIRLRLDRRASDINTLEDVKRLYKRQKK